MPSELTQDDVRVEHKGSQVRSPLEVKFLFKFNTKLTDVPK